MSLQRCLWLVSLATDPKNAQRGPDPAECGVNPTSCTKEDFVLRLWVKPKFLAHTQQSHFCLLILSF